MQLGSKVSFHPCFATITSAEIISPPDITYQILPNKWLEDSTSGKQQTNRQSTRIAPKLVLTLSRRTRNAIYRHSNEARISVVHYLSNKHPQTSVHWIDLVTAGFVKTVAHTSLENERCKKRTYCLQRIHRFWAVFVVDDVIVYFLICLFSAIIFCCLY